MQTGFGTNPASYQSVVRFFHRCKPAGEWRWLLISIYRRGNACMELTISTGTLGLCLKGMRRGIWFRTLGGYGQERQHSILHRELQFFYSPPQVPTMALETTKPANIGAISPRPSNVLRAVCVHFFKTHCASPYHKKQYRNTRDHLYLMSSAFGSLCRCIQMSSLMKNVKSRTRIRRPDEQMNAILTERT
jgi:hypothetical protein